MNGQKSPTVVAFHSPPIPNLPQVGFNRRIQPCRFLLMLAPLGTKSLHLFLKWFVVVFLLCCTDIATGGEHMAVLADLFEGGAFAETGDIGVLPGLLLAAPGMVGIGDLLNIGITEFSPGAVHQGAHITGVDKQYLAAPVAQGLFAAFAVGLVAGEEPQAGGDLG